MALISTISSFNGLGYIFSIAKSSAQSYVLSGTGLTGFPSNIVITAPSDYEVSTNNLTFTQFVDIPFTTSELIPTSIYVRLKSNLAIGNYNSQIITNIGGGNSIDITVNATIYEHSFLRRLSILDSKSSTNSFLNRTSIEEKDGSLASHLKDVSIEDTIKGGNSHLKRLTIEDRQCLKCQIAERDISFALKVSLPIEFIPNREFKECCYENIVLANLNSSNDWENDYNSVYFKRQTDTDTCDFTLVKLLDGSTYDLNNSTYGKFWDFGDFTEQPDLKVYRLEWRKVLTTLGEGAYLIRKEKSIVGILIDEDSNTYNLKAFNNDIADNTIRMDILMNGEIKHYSVDFKGTDFRTTLRTKGYFGNKISKYVQENLIRRDQDFTEQISIMQENEYVLETGLIPECITNEIYNFMLFADEIFISDYNKANHSYRYLVYPVVLKENKDQKYYKNNRASKINISFEDRYKNKRKINY